MSPPFRYLFPAFLLIVVAGCLVPWQPIFNLGLADDEYSHILVMPFIAASIVYIDREGIFREVRPCPAWGTAIGILGIALACLGRLTPSLAAGGYDLAVSTLGALVAVDASFVLCFGFGPLARAAFPLALLLLSMPVPRPLMSPIIRSLQNGSALFSAALFKLFHVPALRQNLVFSLPGFDIEIAEQCSGIRSSIALCIASSLAGHLFLRAWWRKLLLVLITLPLVILKNAVRIVTISSLGVYVSRSFLYGKLHHYSGLPFSLVELAIIVPLLIRWHRLDTRALAVCPDSSPGPRFPDFGAVPALDRKPAPRPPAPRSQAGREIATQQKPNPRA